MNICFPLCESNGNEYTFWNILLDYTLDYESLKTNNVILAEREKILEVLRFLELLKTILDQEEHLPLIS